MLIHVSSAQSNSALFQETSLILPSLDLLSPITGGVGGGLTLLVSALVGILANKSGGMSASILFTSAVDVGEDANIGERFT